MDTFLQHKGGNGKLNLELTSATIASDYDYSKAVLTSVHKSKLEKLQLNTRLFGQYGSGKNWAGESRLNLAGANSEERRNISLQIRRFHS